MSPSRRNYRTRIREASPNFSSPIFFGATKKSSMSSGTGGSLTHTSGATRNGAATSSGNTPATSPALPTSDAFEPVEREKRGDGDERRRGGGSDKKSRRGKKASDKGKRAGGEDSGTGITVQTVSWVLEEERTDEDRQDDKIEMVVERGKKVSFPSRWELLFRY